MRMSISEIIGSAGKVKSKKEKIEILQKNQSVPLQTILKLTYDPSVEWLLPDSEPPYNPSEAAESHGMLYSHARRLRIFHKGGGYDNLNQVKREALFIELLESVDKGDAQVLVDMIVKRKLKGLTDKTVLEAFPGLF